MRQIRHAIVPAIVHALENRVLLSVAAGSLEIPSFQLFHRPGEVAASSSTPQGGITPSQMLQAYGISSIQFGSVAGNGAGQTIAIIDAYHDPNAASDLANFDSFYGLAQPPSFTQLDENGGTNFPSNAPTGGWGIEESLDIEWAHVIAPAANIILYDADSTSDSDLIQTAVVTAENNPNVTAISMSFGGGEFSGETDYDSVFTSSHITFLASAGDNGSPGAYPAYSPNVIAVGGTSLSVSSSGAYQSETGWSSSGGGISSQESEPAYQTSVQTTGDRTIPDVSMDADPDTGVPVYDSYDNGSSTPWITVGGTSLSCPMWSGLVAITDQGRIANGLSIFDTVSNPSANNSAEALPLLYRASTSDFHDITSGSNGGFSAAVGYDEVTGIGSPVANLLIPYLAGNVAKTPAVTGITPTSGPAAGGTSVTITGAGFTGATAVDFGSTPASSFTVNNDDSITAIDPAGSGTVDVTVITPGGTSATSTADQFSYSSGLPAWLGAGSAATYNASTNTLTVTGSATIIADPGATAPNIVASGAAAKLTIAPATSPTDVHIGGVTLTGGASVVMSSVGSARSHSNHNVLVIGTLGAANDPTISIDSSSKLDLGDNDLLVHTGSSDNGNGTPDQAMGVVLTNELKAVAALAATGRNVAVGGVYDGTWTGDGLTSSAAATADNAANAGYEQNILAVAQNNDMFLGGYSKWTVGSASETLGAHDILVKYTYNGDLNLDGAVDGNASAIFSTFFDNGATTGDTYAEGDLNGDGKINGNDAAIFSTVFNNGLSGSGLVQL